MSRYQTIQTKFTDLELIKQVLRELKVPFDFDFDGENRLILAGGGWGQGRQTAALAVRKKFTGNLYEDIGWVKAPQLPGPQGADQTAEYIMQVGAHQDKEEQALIGHIQQLYGLHNYQRLGQLNGYVPMVEVDANDVINLILVHA